MDNWYSIGGFSDPMSSLSHLVGTVAFAIMSVFFLKSAWRSRSAFWFSFQFIVASLFMLSMSFVYHMMVRDGVARDVMLRLDTAAIFVLIASTFTVFHGILVTGWKRWSIIGLVWLIAVTGISVRSALFHSIPSIVGDGVFLVMGWIGAYSAWLIQKDYGWKAVVPIVMGGVLYSVGAIIDATEQLIFIDRIWGPHETFHLFVLAALGVHWSFAWSLADGSFHRRFGKVRAETTAEESA